MQGSENQVELAGRIKLQVNAEFDRVAAAFESVADRQAGSKRDAIESILAILEEKRAEVLAVKSAGFFIQGWQQIGDQVRQLIFHDPRYPAIKAILATAPPGPRPRS